MSAPSILAAALLALAPIPAAAQDKSDFDRAETRVIAHRFAICVVKGNHKLALKAIVEHLTNSEMIREHKELLDGKCLVAAAGDRGTQMRFPGDTFRYALADALVARDFEGGLPNLAAVPPLAHRDYANEDAIEQARESKKRKKPLKPEELAEIERDRKEALSFTYLSQFGECVVRANPQGSLQLLRSKPEGDDEKIAFRVLQSTFDNCLQAGKMFVVNRMILRGTVALNAYRLARAPAQAAAGAAR